jgi:DNA-binding MarR family transcriptional regulator
MSTTPTFTPQLLGQTEKALNALLDRLLNGTGVTEPQWVTLSIVAIAGEALTPDQLTEHAAGALKLRDADARARVDELTAAKLLSVCDGDAPMVRLTDAGRQLYARVREGVAEVTAQMWGDLPDEDLATAGRVLGIVLERANAELAAT